MLKLTIDNQVTQGAPGETILAVAAKLGVEIPTLCHNESLPHLNACMVCLVRDKKTGRMMPACSYPVEDGMDIDASSACVRQARHDALDLLLREHFGDCEAPCRRGCPAGLDIAAMMKAVADGNWAAAGRIVRATIPIPMILGEICPAPCEKVCRRKDVDAALRIRDIKGLAGRLSSENLSTSGAVTKPVAVVGGGPAGVSTAFFLKKKGYDVTIYERESSGWEALGAKVGTGFNLEIIREEYEKLEQAGLSYVNDREIKTATDLSDLLNRYAAVVLAGGQAMRENLDAMGVRAVNTGYATSLPGVFVCGAAREDCGKLAVRAVADAQKAAMEVQAFVEGEHAPPIAKKRFDSRAGTLTDLHLASLAAGAIADVANSDSPEILGLDKPRPWKLDALPSTQIHLDADTFNHQTIRPSNHPALKEAARREASRCMNCGCRAGESCQLRDYADDYDVSPPRALPPAVLMESPLIIRDHPSILFEPGKCIHCGLCVRLTEAAGEPFGLTFLGRGRGTRVAPPLGVSWAEAVTFSARQCAEICPTGALTLRDPSSI